MSFTGAFRIYFGNWPAVTVKFRADNIEPGGFLSMGECQFHPRPGGQNWESDRTRSGGGCCSVCIRPTTYFNF